jgi:diphthine synthase
MLYVIGLGLSDERDITLRGLQVNEYTPHTSHRALIYYQAIKGSVRVYLEAYTSILMIQKERLVRTTTQLQFELFNVHTNRKRSMKNH